YDDPRHSQSRADTLPGIAHQGLYVVSEKNHLLIRRELEESLVVRAVQSSILNSHHVQTGDLAPKSALSR
ncbi:MAG TPA: hypothetical protein VFE33_02985, partial [Thermoanaerobaculia bacterium]|nr:hypothetical protein [Thermoanaerobaculia bacterium]